MPLVGKEEPHRCLQSILQKGHRMAQKWGHLASLLKSFSAFLLCLEYSPDSLL